MYSFIIIWNAGDCFSILPPHRKGKQLLQAGQLDAYTRNSKQQLQQSPTPARPVPATVLQLQPQQASDQKQKEERDNQLREMSTTLQQASDQKQKEERDNRLREMSTTLWRPISYHFNLKVTEAKIEQQSEILKARSDLVEKSKAINKELGSIHSTLSVQLVGTTTFISMLVAAEQLMNDRENMRATYILTFLYSMFQFWIGAHEGLRRAREEMENVVAYHHRLIRRMNRVRIEVDREGVAVQDPFLPTGNSKRQQELALNSLGDDFHQYCEMIMQVIGPYFEAYAGRVGNLINMMSALALGCILGVWFL